MAKTVYLHIGMNKTGSSAIQNYLAKNREQLGKRGLLYPWVGCEGNAHYGLSTLLGFSHGNSKGVNLGLNNLMEKKGKLNSEIENSLANSVVISSEYFVLPSSIQSVKEFLSDYDVKVIVYLRRHDKWWPSAYNQAVRTVVHPPWGRTFRAYLNFFRKKRPWIGDYRLLVERWSEVFGKESILLRPYETQQNEPGLVHDFMKTISCGELAENIPPDSVRVNHSVGMEALAIVDACQRANIDPQVRAAIICKVLANQKEGVNAVSFEPQLLLELATKHQEDYAYLAREYLGRDDGRLFYDPLPEVTADWARNKPPTLDAVVESVVSAMNTNLCDEIKALA